VASAGVILVVDDQETNQQICQENLELEDFKVHVASNGLEGLEAAREIMPDLILLDIMMPVMDGYQTLAKLKDEPALDNIPVLMLSAKAGSQEVAKALSMGASDYVKKPFSVDELIARVRHLVAFKQTQEVNQTYLKHLEEHQRRLGEELSLAASIQRSLLPDDRVLADLPERGAAVSVFTRPAGVVNGDFCDIRRLEADLLSFFVADCKGHGVSAGMMTMAVRALLDSLPPAYTSARESLFQLDRQLRRLALSSEFVVMGHLLYSLRDKEAIIASAGIPCPLLYHAATETTEGLSLKGSPLSLPVASPSLEEVKLTLKGGDKLILFSDGLIEARDEAGEFFGIPTAKMISRVNEQGRLPAGDLSAWLVEEWERFHQGRQEDDCTVVILECLEASGRGSG
jgi:CheY-like chemotaxis protein